MTFEFQILITSAIFCVLILVVLGIQKKGFLKHKAVTILLLIVTSLFFCASLFFVIQNLLPMKQEKNNTLKEIKML